MNYKAILHYLGTVMKVEAGLMVLPFLVSLVYREKEYFAFIVPIALLLALGFLFTIIGKGNRKIYAKEGLVVTALSWIVMSLFGALPFVFSGQIPRFVDAFFEIVSGFTTTGASVVADVESMGRGILFWRSFSIWIGGMGILVFALAILPSTDARTMYLMKAESPGPTVGKLVSKVAHTARILYGIYMAMTILLIVLLSFSMPFFDALVNAFSTAGTGGFSITNTSIAAYGSLYTDIIITVFMILFGVNFNVFYLLLLGNLKGAWKSEEVRWYFGIILASILAITLGNLSFYHGFWESLRYSSFQVGSIITTTGFSTADFNLWSPFSQAVLLGLMMIGACASSTGGGMKVSRAVIATKLVFREVGYEIHPREVSLLTFEGKPVDSSVKIGISAYLIAYFVLLFGSTLLLTLEGKDLVSTFSAVTACFNNVGPGLGEVGPMGNYSGFSDAGKVLLSFLMLAGRLEIFPILLLFSPNLWRLR